MDPGDCLMPRPSFGRDLVGSMSMAGQATDDFTELFPPSRSRADSGVRILHFGMGSANRRLLKALAAGNETLRQFHLMRTSTKTESRRRLVLSHAAAIVHRLSEIWRWKHLNVGSHTGSVSGNETSRHGRMPMNQRGAKPSALLAEWKARVCRRQDCQIRF